MPLLAMHVCCVHFWVGAFSANFPPPTSSSPLDPSSAFGSFALPSGFFFEGKAKGRNESLFANDQVGEAGMGMTTEGRNN